jgi:hypothetical protein
MKHQNNNITKNSLTYQKDRNQENEGLYSVPVPVPVPPPV